MQTETGWCIAGPRGVGPHARRRICATPGFDLRCLGADGRGQAADEPGKLVLRLPLPPGCLAGLWRDPARMQASYLDKCRGFRTFDYGRFDVAGNVMLLSRVDDVVKVAGRLVATGTIEDVLAAHPDVAECAVAACDDALRGQRPIAHVVPKNGLDAARPDAPVRPDQIGAGSGGHFLRPAPGRLSCGTSSDAFGQNAATDPRRKRCSPSR